MSSIMRWRSGVIESSIAGWERLRAALPCWLKRSLSGAQELSHRLPEARASCFAPSRDTARYAQRLVQCWLSKPDEPDYRRSNRRKSAPKVHRKCRSEMRSSRRVERGRSPLLFDRVKKYARRGGGEENAGDGGGGDDDADEFGKRAEIGGESRQYRASCHLIAEAR